MRIISGSAKSKRLADFSGSQIRPTSDRVREALFSILCSRLGTFEGKTVLDLFAGTGAMSLEALSRGAKKACLVDQGNQAARIIAENAKTCNLQHKMRFLRGDVLKKLPEIIADGPFDLIFLDPPYDMGLVKVTLHAIGELGLLRKDGIACAEASTLEDLPERAGDLHCILQRRYGSTLVGLFSLSETET